MDCSLINFLETGRLGDLQIGARREFVLGVLGTPSWWQGKPEISLRESSVWDYSPLQVLFSADHTVDLIRLCYTPLHEAQFSDGSISQGPLRFLDINPCSIAQYETYIQFLENSSIPFQKGVNSERKQTIRTSCALTKFSRVLHHEESVQAEHAILSDSLYLVSITGVA